MKIILIYGFFVISTLLFLYGIGQLIGKAMKEILKHENKERRYEE